MIPINHLMFILIKIQKTLYKHKKYTHKRIWQVGMIMKVRLEVLHLFTFQTPKYVIIKT